MANLSLEKLVKNFKLDLDKFENFDGKLPIYDGSQDLKDLAVGAVVDFETTDLNVKKYGEVEATEIGAVKFYYHKTTFEFYGVKEVLNQLNEPSSSDKMTDKIKEITGMVFDDVKGHSFNLEEIKDFFKDCDFVYAHNARFDRPFLEKIVSDLKWACSRDDIDWDGQGYVTEQQELLALQVGFRYSAHRASTDCLANLKILLDSNNFSSFVKEVFTPKGKVVLDGFLDPYGETTMKELLKDKNNEFGTAFGFNKDNKTWVSKSIVKKVDSSDLIKKIKAKYEEVYGGHPKYSCPKISLVEKK